MRDRIFILAFIVIVSGESLIQSAAEILRGEFPDALNVLRTLPTEQYLRKFEHDLELHSVMGSRLRPYLRGGLAMILGATGKNALVGRNGWLFFKPGAAASTSRLPAQADGPAQAVIAAAQFRANLQQRGIQLLTVVAPNKESIHPESLRGPSNVGWIPPATREFLAGCMTHEIPVLDLHIDFVRNRKNVPLYMKQDSHWSREGIRVAAEAIAQRIGPRPNATTRLRETEIVIKQDLIRTQNILLPGGGPHPESVPAWQVVDHISQSPALGVSEDSDVLVIGDSFLNAQDVDSPAATGFIAHLAHALGRPVTVLCFPGGGATVIRKKLASQPGLLKGKTWVVWEFIERDLSMANEGWPVVRIPQEIPDSAGGEP